MTNREFETLSKELEAVATRIPHSWGSVQNNRTDDKIDMFSLHTYAALEYAVRNLDVEERNYLKRRWYLWKCSQCDEYLFYRNENVEKNPNPFDKDWDIRIGKDLYLDIKGTVIPKGFWSNVADVLRNPAKIIEYYYEKQSKGRRYDIQNRLFIVHHSLVHPQRELYLRCAWEKKKEIYDFFCRNAEKVGLYETRGVKAGVIFILETDIDVIKYKIMGL